MNVNMGLFKKPNRKFRQRVTRTDSEDEGGSAESPESKEKKTLKSDLKDKSVTEVKNCSSVAVAPVCSASVSSKEKDDKLDPSQPKATKLLSFHDDEDDTEVFKLKKSNYSRRLAKQREKEKKKKEEIVAISELCIKSEPQESTLEESKDEAVPKENEDKESWDAIKIEGEDMEVESDDEEKEKSNPFKNVLQSGVIPDAATIYAMKKHRQMAREMGDFIPVEDPEKDDESKSRLIREDDNDRSDDDDDDEPSRLNFTVNTGAVERQKIRETFLSLQEGDQEETEDAAEVDRWEQEQIRKGVSVTQVAPSQNNAIVEPQMYSYPPSESYIPPMVLVKGSTKNLTTQDIKSRLEERLSALKAQHASHERELKDCQQEFLDATDFVKKLEKDGPELAQNFFLFQQMSGYVKDLVECLDLKVAHINLLDGRMTDLYKNKTQRLLARRQQDVRDQCDEYSTLSSDILKGVSAEFLIEKPTDEAKLRRAAEREGRRMRRRKQRERSALIVKHQDGFSSDNEEADIDVLGFKEKRESILSEAGTIFEDVVEDFGSLEGVMRHFEHWKRQHATSYTDAYVPLCLPHIFGPFVKLALLDWNPLQEQRDIENMAWYQRLLHYGRGEHEECDVNLLPSIVERVVVPKVSSYVENAWDPLSSVQSHNLVTLLKQLLQKFPISGNTPQFQTCLKTITMRIQAALDDDVFIPLYPKELLENRSLGASDFFQRQFYSAVKLLQNMVVWEGLLGEAPLQALVLCSLLNRYLVMGLHTSLTLRDTVDKCKLIAAALPKAWFAGGGLSALAQFAAFLLKFADAHHALCAKRGEESRDLIKELVQILVSVEAMDAALTLAKKYGISGFKN